MNMKTIITTIYYILLSTFAINAQIKWFNPIETEGFSCIHNQGWNEDGENYNRFPNRPPRQVKTAVKIPNNTEKLYYLSKEELGLDPDSWVDYVHPSDYGMIQQSNAIHIKLKEII